MYLFVTFIYLGIFHADVWSKYGVALVSRINKITSLFCKRALLKRQYSAKETFDHIDPANRSHPIGLFETHMNFI